MIRELEEKLQNAAPCSAQEFRDLQIKLDFFEKKC
jgi:hypothetical protein